MNNNHQDVKKKILLIGLNYCSNYSLSLGYLKSYAMKESLLEKNAEIIIKDYCLKHSDDRGILFDVSKVNPDFIGFSIYCWNCLQLLKIASSIKKIINKKTYIIFGGPEASERSEELLKNYVFVDYIVRGEGEITFSELVTALIDNKNLKDIKGLLYRNKNEIIVNEARSLIDNLDILPSPYLTDNIDMENKIVYLESYRGCKYKCAYCYERKNNNELRFFSLKRVEEEIKYLLFNKKIKCLTFTDPIFNVSKDRTINICKLLIKYNKNKIPINSVEIDTESLDDEIINYIKKAHIESIETGPQSINKGTLQIITRSFNKQIFCDNIRKLSSQKINVCLDLIFGLPGDNFFKYVRTIRFVLSLPSNEIHINRLKVLPGTEIHIRKDKYNLKYEDNGTHQILSTSSFGYDEIEKADILSNSILHEFNVHNGKI
ncbi:MAG: radical SAM protein [archaeon]